MVRLAAALLLATMLLGSAGCGDDDPELSALCTADARTLERALESAPAAVRLRDGTRLSDCVSRARSDSELQTAGLVISTAADHLLLRAQNDPRAATALGYLVGAVRRGAGRTNGIHLELARRMDQTAAQLDQVSSETSAALRKGLRAGQASG